MVGLVFNIVKPVLHIKTSLVSVGSSNIDSVPVVCEYVCKCHLLSLITPTEHRDSILKLPNFLKACSILF